MNPNESTWQTQHPATHPHTDACNGHGTQPACSDGDPRWSQMTWMTVEAKISSKRTMGVEELGGHRQAAGDTTMEEARELWSLPAAGSVVVILYAIAVSPYVHGNVGVFVVVSHGLVCLLYSSQLVVQQSKEEVIVEEEKEGRVRTDEERWAIYFNSDLLPPCHLRWLLLHLDISSKPAFAPDATPSTWISCLTSRGASAAPCAPSTSASRDSWKDLVKRLSLEFFVTGNGCSLNRLIAEAIDAWGVEELEAIAKPLYFNHKQQDAVHAFPSHGLCKEPRSSRLRTLKLGRCALPPLLHEYGALTMLVLRDIQSTPPAAYEAVFTSCPKLQTLHLILCSCRSSDSGTLLPLVVDAPSSDIRELVVDNCSFRWIRLRRLPCLESLASLGTGAGSRVFFDQNSFPSLRRSNFAMRLGFELELEYVREYFALPPKLDLDMFLRCTQGPGPGRGNSNRLYICVFFCRPRAWKRRKPKD
ncbi:hypothetical protein VPH35_062829 [Triticum aestivum]|uniref:FBD domain-containing protein n=1 Tax=Aegilops tauschii TaxID=37682 RepID=M8B7S0_AEGTA